MATIAKTLYDTDFGKRDFRAVESQLRRMLVHLIERKVQPERDGTSWHGSIANAQEELLVEFRDSPSLRRRLSGEIEDVYAAAIRIALIETGSAARRADLGIPDLCPYMLAHLLDSDPEALRF